MPIGRLSVNLRQVNDKSDKTDNFDKTNNSISSLRGYDAGMMQSPPFITFVIFIKIINFF